MSVLATVVVIIAPLFNPANPAPGWHQFFAILMTFLAAALAAQVSGELVQIAEWALFNYQRERRTTEALFENRQALERSLVRSQALSEELQETNSELEAARFAAEEAKHFRGQFLANMSHELRTPLNAIIGFSETMLRFPAMYDGITLPTAYEGDLSQIYNSGRQLLSLINDILDLSKVDAGKLELHLQRVEIGPIIESTLATAAGLLSGKSIRLERNLPDVLPQVWADEGRIRQVLMNLYSNAVKFTDSGSITLTVRETGEGVLFSVKDTGMGIDPAYHEVIFEEFKQANNSAGRDPRSGSGLGLTISRQLLNLMGGRIWVESERGKGSAFNFVVQLYRYQDDGSQPKRPAELPASSAPKTQEAGQAAEKVV
jgi:signal transduction histidine kinase